MNPNAEQAGLTRDNRPVMLASAMQTSDRLGLLRALREEALAVATQRQQARRELAEEADGADVFLYGFARGRVQGLDDAIALVSDPSEAVQSARVLLALEIQRAYDKAVVRAKEIAAATASHRDDDPVQRTGDAYFGAYASGELTGLRRALTIIIGVGNRVDEDGIYEPCQTCGLRRVHSQTGDGCASCNARREHPCVTCGKPLRSTGPAECFRCSDRRGDAEQDAIALHADGLL